VLDDFHRGMKARPKRERTSFRPRSIPGAARNEAKENPVRGLVSNGASSREAAHTTGMRDRHGGTIPPVATNGLPGSGLRNDHKLRGVLLWTPPEIFSFEKNSPEERFGIAALIMDGPRSLG